MEAASSPRGVTVELRRILSKQGTGAEKEGSTSSGSNGGGAGAAGGKAEGAAAGKGDGVEALDMV